MKKWNQQRKYTKTILKSDTEMKTSEETVMENPKRFSLKKEFSSFELKSFNFLKNKKHF